LSLWFFVLCTSYLALRSLFFSGPLRATHSGMKDEWNENREQRTKN
jgi:hypothetical protein